MRNPSIPFVVIVTDYELKSLADGIDVLIKPPAAALEQMDDYVRNMHISSGLLADLKDGVTMEAARETVLNYVTSLVPEARTVQLAGNSESCDAACGHRPSARSLLLPFLVQFLLVAESYPEGMRSPRPYLAFFLPATVRLGPLRVRALVLVR